MSKQEETPMPRFGKTALELLDSKGNEPHSLFSQFGVRLLGGIFGAGLHTGGNWAYKRPLFAGIQKYPIYFTAGWFGAHFMEQYRQNYLAERDAVLRHYIQLHPDDFPAPERKKYGELLTEWVPIR